MFRFSDYSLFNPEPEFGSRQLIYYQRRYCYNFHERYCYLGGTPLNLTLKEVETVKIIQWTVKILGAFLALITSYLLIVAFLPGFPQPKQTLQRGKLLSRDGQTKPPASRKDVSFSVNGTAISAWLYLPRNISTPFPCIIMANGLGGTKNIILQAYARRFQSAGFAVLAFDYRHFGDSQGEPRQLIWIPYQLEDYAAAVEHARSLPEIDPQRIALWGTSLSGGHVLVTAAKDKQIACVSAQCPGLDGRAGAEMAFNKYGLAHGLKMIVHGQRDLVRSWLGRSPHKIPIAGQPGSIALMTTPDAYIAFSALSPENFVNEACARITIRGDKYRPVKYAKDVHCPVLLQICEKDDLTPLSAAEETAQILGELAEVKYYPIGHFDIYLGDNFKKSVSDQLEFFKKHL